MKINFIIIFFFFFKVKKFEMLFLFKSFLNNFFNNENYNLLCPLSRLNNYNEKNIYFLNCIFSDFSITGSGSVIFSQNTNNYLLIEYSTFNNCHGTENGGAIYLNNPNGKFSMNFICSNNCYTLTYGQLSFGKVSSNFESNYYYISLLNSRNYKVDPIRIENGIINFKNSNISNCYSYQTSGLFLGNVNNSIINFCTFFKNEAYSCCIFIEGGIGYQKLEYSNIINNKVSNVGILYGSSEYIPNFICSNLIIKNNLGTLSSGYLIIDNSFIEHSNIGSASHLNSNNQYIITNTFLLNHFNTLYCYAENKFFFNFKTNFFHKKIFFNLYLQILNV